jgi:hypothetical protein
MLVGYGLQWKRKTRDVQTQTGMPVVDHGVCVCVRGGYLVDAATVKRIAIQRITRERRRSGCVPSIRSISEDIELSSASDSAFQRLEYGNGIV